MPDDLFPQRRGTTNRNWLDWKTISRQVPSVLRFFNNDSNHAAAVGIHKVGSTGTKNRCEFTE